MRDFVSECEDGGLKRPRGLRRWKSLLASYISMLDRFVPTEVVTCVSSHTQRHTHIGTDTLFENTTNTISSFRGTL